MKIEINRNLNTRLYAQIKNSIREKILEGELADGFKLPPERVLAKELGVHRNTVIRAYEALIEEDLIKSSISPRGYFVTYSRQEDFRRVSGRNKSYPGALSFMLKEEYLQMDTLFSQLFYNQDLSKSSREMISLAADIISPALYPKERLNQLLREITEKNSFDWFGFLPPQGLPELIHSIQTLLSSRHIKASTREIQVVSETYEAIQYVLKILVSPCDTIIAEEPISPDMLQAFQFSGVNVITIPVDQEGMETQYLEGLIVKYRPKLIYTIPTFHFPTSAVMSLSRRYELLSISYKYDIPIIEEDCDSVLRYEGPALPSLKALDTVGNVIYINSFIGTICPGVRTAYLTAPEKIISKLSMIMENTRMFVNPIGQYLTSRFIDSGYLEESVDKICTFTRSNRDCLCRALLETPDIRYDFSIPKGGTSLWCCVEEEINPKELLYKAHQLGVSYMPGNLFFPFRSKGDQYLRLCFGNSTHGELIQGVARISEAIRQTR